MTKGRKTEVLMSKSVIKPKKKIPHIITEIKKKDNTVYQMTL